MIFHVTLEYAEDGWIVAECPALPGCVSQGKDEKEALENIKEAITAWLWAEDQKATAAFGWDNSPLWWRYNIWQGWVISRAKRLSKPSKKCETSWSS